MSPAPYLDDAEAILAGAHGHIVRARATGATFTMPLALVDEAGAVSLDYDEQRAPRVQARLLCALPATLEDLERLDPRAGVRVELDLGYRRPGGAQDVATVADLGLRRVSVNYADRTMSLSLAGDEALVVDASSVAVGKVDTPTHRAGVQALLEQAISPAPNFVANVPGDTAALVDPLTDRWATAQDLADRKECALYDDGLRTFVLEPVPTVATTPAASLTVGDGGTVLEPEADLARDAWFNYVCLRYRWRNAAGADQVITATAYVSSGPYAISGDAGKRILLDERNVPTTQAAANAAARAILVRQLSRSRSFTFTAIAAYWVRPGSTVSVTLPGGRPEAHLVSRVSFQPLVGTMTLATRLPDVASSIATTTAPPAVPTDPSPAPTPDPAPPAKVRYVSEWVASSSATYRGNGVKRTDLPESIAQGYNPGSINGNQSSVVLFTGANSTPAPGQRGETGKSITQALTGATVHSVQAWAYATHWWSAAGGTGRVGWARLSALPATFTGAKVRANEDDWARNSGRWVTLTSSELAAGLLSGDVRAITYGPGIGTSTEFYGLLAGAAHPSTAARPKLRITYSK